MMTETLIWQYALPACNALLLALAALAILGCRRELRALRADNTARMADAVKAAAYDDRELRRMIDRRLSMQEKFLERLMETSAREATAATLPAVAPQKNELPVDYAVRMARGGASLEDLVRGCGLNRGEAELLLRLHGKAAGASAATH